MIVDSRQRETVRLPQSVVEWIWSVGKDIEHVIHGICVIGVELQESPSKVVGSAVAILSNRFKPILIVEGGFEISDNRRDRVRRRIGEPRTRAGVSLSLWWKGTVSLIYQRCRAKAICQEIVLL